MEEREKNNKWIKILVCVILGLAAIFVIFYIAVMLALHQMLDPLYNSKQIEKMLKQQEKNFERFETELGEHPFLPKNRPMLVNLTKESSEYRVIVDLKPLDGNENGVTVKIKDNIISVDGSLDKQTHRGEEILKFSQSYYLDEKLDTDNITKVKRGDKYIVTIPFKG